MTSDECRGVAGYELRVAENGIGQRGLKAEVGVRNAEGESGDKEFGLRPLRAVGSLYESHRGGAYAPAGSGNAEVGKKAKLGGWECAKMGKRNI